MMGHPARIARGIPPGRPAAPVVSHLRAAGAVVLGKTNMHELALGGTSINPFYGTVPNPWQPEHIAGGSSGGSAAAVASGVGYGSIGSSSATRRAPGERRACGTGKSPPTRTGDQAWSSKPGLDQPAGVTRARRAG
jgi:hypothetical protein